MVIGLLGADGNGIPSSIPSGGRSPLYSVLESIGYRVFAASHLCVMAGVVKRAKAVTEDRLGERITLTAYPFGKPKRHFTAETMEIVSKVGYECAAAITYQSVCASRSRYAVPRYYVTGDSVRVLQEKIFGAWDLLGVWHQRAPAFLQR